MSKTSKSCDISPPKLTSPIKRKPDEAKKDTGLKRKRNRRSGKSVAKIAKQGNKKKSGENKTSKKSGVRKQSLRSSKRSVRVGASVSRAASKIRIGARLKAPGTRWSLAANTFFYGTILR